MQDIKDFFNIKDKIEREAEGYVNKNKECICCGKKILPFKMTDINDNDVNVINPYQQHKAMWDDSILAKISGGYGSRHDMCSYYIAICDSCITDKVKAGIIEDCREIEKKVPNDFKAILSERSRFSR